MAEQRGTKDLVRYPISAWYAVGSRGLAESLRSAPARGLSQLCAAFQGCFGQFGAALTNRFGQLGCAFANCLSQTGCALPGHVQERTRLIACGVGELTATCRTGLKPSAHLVAGRSEHRPTRCDR